MFFLAQAQSLLNAWTQGLVNYVNNVIQSFVHTTPPPAIQPGHPAYQIGAGLQAWLISLLIASNQAIYGYIAQNPPPNAVPTVAPTPTPGPTTTPTPSPTPGGVLANPSTLSFASVTAGQQFVSLSETYYTGSFSASATPANLVTLTASGNGFYVAPVNTGTGGAGTITFSDSLGNFINVPFTINQTPVPGNITFSPVSASLTQIGATQTVNILETNYSGGFTAVSGNTSVASVSVSGSQMTVTAVGNGNTNITVSNSGTQSSQFPVAVNSTPVIGPITLSPQTLTFNLPSTTAQPFTISDPGNTTGFTITGQSNIVTTSVSGSGASATVQVTPTGTAGTVTLSVADQAGTTPAQVVVSVNPVTLPNPSYTNTYPTAVSAGVPSYPVSIASVAFAAHSTITGEINGPANPAGSSMLAAPNGTATLFSLTGGQFNSSANTGQAAEQHAYDGEGAQQAFPSTDLAPGQTYLLAETTDGTYVYDFICAIPNASNNCAQYTTNDSAFWTAGNYKLYIGVGADGTSRPALAGTRIFNINIYSSALNLAQINLLSQSAIADPYPAGPLTANPANLSFSNPTATAQTVAVTDPEFQGSTYTITSSNTSIVTVGSLSGSPTGSSFVATPQSAGNAVITIKDGTNTTTMTVTVAQQSSAFPSANWIPYPSGGPLQTDITTIYGTQAQELGTGTSSCGLTSSGWGAIQQTTTNLSCLHTNSANVINNMYTSQGSSPMAKIRIDLGQGTAWATYYDSTLPITGYLSGGPNAGNDTAAYYVNNDSNAPTMGMYQTGCGNGGSHPDVSYPLSPTSSQAIHYEYTYLPQMGPDLHLFIRDMITGLEWTTIISPRLSQAAVSANGNYWPNPYSSGHTGCSGTYSAPSTVSETQYMSSLGISLPGTAGRISMAYGLRPEDILGMTSNALKAGDHALTFTSRCNNYNSSNQPYVNFPSYGTGDSSSATNDCAQIGNGDQEPDYGGIIFSDTDPAFILRGTSSCTVVEWYLWHILARLGAYKNDITGKYDSSNAYESYAFTINTMPDYVDTYANGTSGWQQVMSAIGQSGYPSAGNIATVQINNRANSCGLSMTTNLHYGIPPWNLSGNQPSYPGSPTQSYVHR